MVVAQRQSDFETVLDVVGQLAEAREHRAVEIIVVQQVGRVSAARADETLSQETRPVVRTLRHDHMTLDVGEIGACHPTESLIARGRQTHFDAGVLLVTLLILVTIAGRRAVRRQQTRVEERRRQRRVLRAGCERAGARRGGRVQAEGRARAIGEEVVGLVVERGNRRQGTDRDRVLRLDRQVDVLLLVLGDDVIEVDKIVLVGVFVEQRTESTGRCLLQRERGIEVDRACIELRELRFGVDRAATLEIGDQASRQAGLFKEIDAIVALVDDIFPLTIGLAGVGRHRSAGVLTNRTAHVGIQLVAVVLTVATAEVELERVGRLARGDDHRAGHSVATVERALRSLQHFDLRNVVEFLVQRVRVGLQHAIDDERKVSLSVATRVDAADRDLKVTGFRRLHLRDARRQRDEVLRTLDASRLDFRGGEGLHRRRHVFEALGALTGGDDDFFELRFLRT